MFRFTLLASAFLGCSVLAAEPHRDGLGDPLPADAIARLGSRRLRLGAFVSAVAVSPTEKIAATGDGDGNLVLWDLASGKELRRVNLRNLPRAGQELLGPLPVTCVAFAPDGKTLAAVCNQRYSFWESSTLKEVQLANVPEGGNAGGGCQAVAFSPDGKWLAPFGTSTFLEPLPLKEDRKPDRFEAYQGPIGAVAFSPDSKLLAAGDGGAIRLWELSSRKQIGKFRRHNGTVNALAFSPDGKLLASGGDDQSIRVWNVESGAEQRRFGHPFTRPATQHFLADYNVTSATVAFSADSSALISSVRSDHFIRRWDVASGKELANYEGHQDGSTCVALSRDGKTLVAGAEDSCLRVWDVASGRDLALDSGHRGRVFNVAFAADGKTVLSAGRDNVIRVWDVADCKVGFPFVAGTPRERTHFGADADRFGLIAFAADGKTLATARHDDETIQIWNAGTGKVVRELSRQQYGVLGLAFAGGSKLASFSMQGDELVCLWNLADGKLVRELKPESGPHNGIGSVSLSSDGRRLASLGSDNSVYVWDVERGQEVRRIGSGLGFRVVLSADGALVAILGRDNSLSLFATASGKLVHKFGMLGLVRDQAMLVPESVAFSPDGRYLAAIGADSALHLWEIATGREVRKFQTGQGWIGSIAFAPDGRAIASGGIDTTILLWDVTGCVRTPPPEKLSASERDQLWEQLRSDDAVAAHRALWTLVALPRESLPFLREQLPPAKPLDPKRFAALVADLDNETFAVRQRATEELEKDIGLAEVGLRKLLDGQPSLEVRQRVEKILERASAGPPSPDRLRAQRALTVLEQIGSAAARQHVEQLTRGAADAWLTRAARKSLERRDDKSRESRDESLEPNKR